MTNQGIRCDTVKCPICGSSSCMKSQPESIDSSVYNCPSCGHFVIDNRGAGFSSSNKHLIAGYLYETRDNYPRGLERIEDFNKENTEKLLSSAIIPKTEMQRLNKIILYIYKQNKGFLGTLHSLDYQIGYARGDKEFFIMIDSLVQMEYLVMDSLCGFGEIRYHLTIKGLTYAESLINENKNSNKVFVAMRFNPEMEEICNRAIKPACENLGFAAAPVNEEEYLGDIPDKIISSIKTSRFVIADFTYNNQGVYYEAGYAKGLGIPVIKTCKKEWFDAVDDNEKKINKLHFDIEHDNLILWKDAKDLKERLEARIQAVIL